MLVSSSYIPSQVIFFTLINFFPYLKHEICTYPSYCYQKQIKAFTKCYLTINFIEKKKIKIKYLPGFLVIVGVVSILVEDVVPGFWGEGDAVEGHVLPAFWVEMDVVELTLFQHFGLKRSSLKEMLLHHLEL